MGILYVICDKDGEPIHVADTKEEADAVVALMSNLPGGCTLAEFEEVDVVSVEKESKELES